MFSLQTVLSDPVTLTVYILCTKSDTNLRHCLALFSLYLATCIISGQQYYYSNIVYVIQYYPRQMSTPYVTTYRQYTIYLFHSVQIDKILTVSGEE